MDDSGTKWHIGWDWHAGMWYVEPPLDWPDDETEWFHDRDEALEYVDEKIREQPVPVSLVDELNVVETVENPALPPYVPRKDAPPEPPPEPVRRVEGLVRNPVPGQNLTSKQERLRIYQDRVGL